MAHDFASLQGQTAIVTGASRGLGFAIAERLARSGAKVHLVARSLEGVQGAAQRIASETGAADPRPWLRRGRCRLGERAPWRPSSRPSPAVEILVNNAGITKDGLLMRMKDEDFDEVVRINLRSVFLWTRALLRPLHQAEIRPHRQHHLHRGRAWPGRPGQLRRLQGRHHRLHQEHGQGSGLPEHHLQRRRPGLHRVAI